MKYAIIENGVVVNIALAGSPLDTNWIESETAGVGYTYSEGIFTAPALVEVPPQSNHLSQFAFKSRMTDVERKAIRAAAKVNEDVEDFMDLANSAKYIDLDDTATRGGIQALEQFGLLAPGRALEILDSPVQLKERP